MRVLVACVLALTSSALGYQVIEPNTSEGWTDVGSQPWVLHSANFPKNVEKTLGLFGSALILIH